MKFRIILISIVGAVLSALTCYGTNPKSGLNPENFKTDSTALYVISNASGMEACLTNTGARLVSLMVPDSKGEFRDVVLGCDNIKDYATRGMFYGASVGRYANRIGGGSFVIDGKEYQIVKNERGNTLHGGPGGWASRAFSVVEQTPSSVKFCLVSGDGDQGFPGELTAFVEYKVTDDNRLEINYTATTTAPTVINVTNHSYFNMRGEKGKESCAEDIVTINAEKYTVFGEGLIPTGELKSVEGSGLDFRKPKTIASGLNTDVRGFDHNYVLDAAGDITKKAAEIYSPESGIVMSVYTTEPGMQFYSPNGAFACFETQHYPDSPNHPEWPTTVLRPGETFSSCTVYAFGVR